MGRPWLNPISAFAAHPRHVVGDWEAGGGRYICLRSRLHELNKWNRKKGWRWLRWCWGAVSVNWWPACLRQKPVRKKKTQVRLFGSCKVHAHTSLQAPAENQATNAPIHTHTLTLHPPLFFTPHLSGLQAINSWNWALANSFIQSLVEKQNAHGLWCTPRTGRYWKWWMVAKTTLSTTLPNTAPCVFRSKFSPNLLLF